MKRCDTNGSFGCDTHSDVATATEAWFIVVRIPKKKPLFSLVNEYNSPDGWNHFICEMGGFLWLEFHGLFLTVRKTLVQETMFLTFRPLLKGSQVFLAFF